MNWISQYIMPKSMTWWIGILLIATGVILNVMEIFGIASSPFLDLLNFIWQTVPTDVSGLPAPGVDGGPTPNMYIVGGLALIGVRKAVKTG